MTHTGSSTELPVKPNQETLAHMFDVLVGDVEDFFGKLLTQDDQSTRRSFVRAVYAMIEGVTFAMKQYALERHPSVVAFEDSELAILKEQQYLLKANGTVEARPSFFRLPENVRFTFSAFARCLRISFELPAGDQGWESFVLSLKTRNRLMHPKSPEDLVVTDDDILRTRQCASWFIASVMRVLLDTVSVAERAVLILSRGDKGKADAILDAAWARAWEGQNDVGDSGEGG